MPEPRYPSFPVIRLTSQTSVAVSCDSLCDVLCAGNFKKIIRVVNPRPSRKIRFTKLHAGFNDRTIGGIMRAFLVGSLLRAPEGIGIVTLPITNFLRGYQSQSDIVK